MKRYLPLLLLSVFLIILFGLIGYWGDQAGQKQKDIPPVTILTIYTTLPLEQIQPLTDEYEKLLGYKINLIPTDGTALLQKLEDSSSLPDIIIADANTLNTCKKRNLFLPNSSEVTDIIAQHFKDPDDYWVGVWYDPIVWVFNLDYARSLDPIPATWKELVQIKGLRISITDFLASEASAKLLYDWGSLHNEVETMQFFRLLHLQTSQYAKFLTTPVRTVGLGEADLAIALYSDALHYRQNGFPLTIIPPGEGTTCWITGAGIFHKTSQKEAAIQFVNNWLLQDQCQEILMNRGIYLLPTNPMLATAKKYNANTISLWQIQSALTPEEEKKLLRNWAQTIRFSLK